MVSDKTITFANVRQISKKKLTEFTNSKLLIVEGQDEINFFDALLEKYLGITDYHIHCVDGKDNFEKQLPLIPNMSGFENVKWLVVIRDADENPNGAFISIKNYFKISK